MISSPSAFPWTLDAPRCGRLISRQLKFMAKNGVRPCVRRFCRFDMHNGLRFRAYLVAYRALHLGCHFVLLLDGELRVNRHMDLDSSSPA